MKRRHKYYRLNYQIQALQLRLIDEKGLQLGILDRNEALKLAQKEGKDLVEVAPNAVPPVVRIIDFKKFKYLEAKKEREARKKVKNVSVKEIRLSPFMGDHDFKTRMSQAEDFLKDGNQLKISIPFRGREITKKEFGMEMAKKAINQLSNIARIVKEPHFEGRVLVTILASQKSAN
ncbi:translation initiation factor IF-3 [Candidatus Gottesmanbacteria bacterium RIFCSPHIGHO2_02_FULL_40_24]|uniref:Translation initiation factor IF-3 n=1 Tax=Candidatus Gottesmanbacteria bacterium RIFCSPHIGHO2_01_FULL_40_15 TaxID=1798376 RepID=A0A1F5Z3A7_9BACT|nr:MAG: translation initiation factor IF-3 [Candidatus Gottesmanbacteria bacterium RIFCSPHIGHO2_01_FULL_40_15]OGG17181.1 MAG: translation initiation factor IF-3 [Candidatus Gottesmanbacteria bacterium RIFCSPHIGHO2_02_FULL_40_24]OGG21240.1 MAG: translation initiation factor IF-3 [Candidatus Gottesmanbacteria bacterium RIFCSPLOWO2_01_FULL_40_10]OGG23575.1 MAG: translation initiation factor IF-3 [Candidatus Gottesmanbacteria bacterium RIFCSPHIGHO2_12_FULL_40_13]OGG32214.1 MAG: translation initiati